MQLKAFHFRLILLSLLTASLTLTGCGDLVPVWVGTAKLDDYTLYHNDTPCTFVVDVPNTPEARQTLSLELEVTYYASGIGRSDLPLYIAIENERKEVQEFKTNVLLNVDGNWLGTLEENDVDYTLSHVAIPALRLPPGKYSMKLFTADPKADKVVGVIKVTARLFKQGAVKNA